MGHVNMASVRRSGDRKIRNLNSSWEVFCSKISVEVVDSEQESTHLEEDTGFITIN